MDRIVNIKNISYCNSGFYPAVYCEPGYILKEYEIICITCGSIRVTFNEKAFILKKGEFCVAPPGVFFSSGGNNEESVAFVCGFEGSLDYDIYKNPVVFTLHEANKKYIDKLIYLTDLSEEKAKQLSRIYIELILTIFSDLPHKKIEYFSKSVQTYKRIYRFLESVCDKKMSVDDISKAVSVNIPNLKKTVLKYTGLGVTNLFNIIKIKKAMEMQEIPRAEDFGFGDKQYFSSLFYKITGKRLKELKNGVRNERNI